MLKFSVIALLLLLANINLFAQEGVDILWNEISKTVAEGDFEGYVGLPIILMRF